MPNKRRKSDIPVVIIDSSTSDEEEDDVDYLGDSSDDDSCGNSNNKKRKKMGISRPNQTRGGETAGKKESKMCHQCQRSDKDEVLVPNVKLRDTVFPASLDGKPQGQIQDLNSGYPRMTEEAFKAYAVCQNLCNCIACLRKLDGLAEVGFFQFFSLSNARKTFTYCKLSGTLVCNAAVDECRSEVQ
ncbi:hypothetical protein HAX54_043502 [Datura stramonium]|uniref:Uncharacterized protein n=1 Tax=Datura stramonium TaxID=4076 RepID=A0ABS8SND0_DATST|nr:hypothetical protein [Datura stramonium]